MTKSSKFDSDAEALAWARSKVERLVEKYRGFEKQARESGEPERASRWRHTANLLEMELIGGSGCVITPFDARLPQVIATMEGTRQR